MSGGSEGDPAAAAAKEVDALSEAVQRPSTASTAIADPALDDDLQDRASKRTYATAAGVQTARCAYVTLVMKTAAYACGVLVLSHSLRRAGSTADVVAMVTADVEAAVRPVLEAADVVVRVVPYLEAVALQAESKRFRGMYTWINACFTKFNCLALTEFTKVAFLDADMFALSNPDALFDLPTPAGICSTVPEASDAAQTAQHGRQLTCAQVTHAVRTSYGIRGCLLVLTPEPALLDRIRARLQRDGRYGDRALHIGPDERLVSELYNDGAGASDGVRGSSGQGPLSRWTHVHARFGLTSWRAGTAPYPAVMLHFVSEKPWQYATYWDDFAQWEAAARALARERPATAAFLHAHSRITAPGPRVHGQPLR